jgi:hypothetical protein
MIAGPVLTMDEACLIPFQLQYTAAATEEGFGLAPRLIPFMVARGRI